MTVPYATPDDVYARALSARAFVVVPRPLNGAAGDFLDPATGIFWMSAHGLSALDVVWFVPTGANALPGGASKMIDYSPIVLSSRKFQLTAGAGPVLYSDVGDSPRGGGTSGWGLLVDFERRLRVNILAESASVDQALTGHSPPLLVDPLTGKYPEQVIDIVCIRAALRSVVGLTFENTEVKPALDVLAAKSKEAGDLKELLRSGVALLPVPKDQTDGVPDNGARAVNKYSSPCSWSTIVRGML